MFTVFNSLQRSAIGRFASSSQLKLVAIGLIALTLLALPTAARAQCTQAVGAVCDGAPCGSVTRPEGTIQFNDDHNVYQVCDNNVWRRLWVIGYGGCLNGYYRRGDSCYKFPGDSRTWADARAICQVDGGDLVVINDAEEHAFLNANRVQSGSFWIGYTDSDVEGTWEWLSPSSYTSWHVAGGEPNGGAAQNCAAIQHAATPGNFVDNACGDMHSYICEAPRSPTGENGCSSEPLFMEGGGKLEVAVPVGCRTATFEGWGAGGSAGIEKNAGGGGGGSVVIRQGDSSVLMAAGGGGGGGGGGSSRGGGGGAYAVAENVVVTPGELLAVYSGEGGVGFCGTASPPEVGGRGGGFAGGRPGYQSSAAGGSVYGGGGGTGQGEAAGSSQFGGGGGRASGSPGGTSTYGGAGGAVGLVGSGAAGGVGDTIVAGSNGSSGTGGAGASGGGRSAGSGGSGVNINCAGSGGDGAVRITWSD